MDALDLFVTNHPQFSVFVVAVAGYIVWQAVVVAGVLAGRSRRP